MGRADSERSIVGSWCYQLEGKNNGDFVFSTRTSIIEQCRPKIGNLNSPYLRNCWSLRKTKICYKLRYFSGVQFFFDYKYMFLCKRKKSDFHRNTVKTPPKSINFRCIDFRSSLTLKWKTFAQTVVKLSLIVSR